MLLVFAFILRPEDRLKADDHLMTLVPFFLVVVLAFIKERWADESEALQGLIGVFAAVAIAQFFLYIIYLLYWIIT